MPFFRGRGCVFWVSSSLGSSDMAPQGSDELIGARLKVDRAKQHVLDLHSDIRIFLDSDPYTILVENDAKTGDEVYRVQVNANPPLDWGVRLGEILHNLRSALDLLAWQLVVEGQAAPTSKTAFPISNTAKQFRSRGLRKVKGASDRSIRLVEALKPYQGGNDALWWLHKLSIEDKHHLLGWRFEQGFPAMVLGVAIVLLFGYSMSWVMATIGLTVKTPEAAQTAGFLPIFPLVFASSVFVPVETMPSWLQTFAEVQPITILTNTARSLMLPVDVAASLGLDTGTLILQSLAWTAAILLVFVPWAVRQYRRAVD